MLKFLALRGNAKSLSTGIAIFQVLGIFVLHQLSIISKNLNGVSVYKLVNCLILLN